MPKEVNVLFADNEQMLKVKYFGVIHVKCLFMMKNADILCSQRSDFNS